MGLLAGYVSYFDRATMRFQWNLKETYVYCLVKGSLKRGSRKSFKQPINPLSKATMRDDFEKLANELS